MATYRGPWDYRLFTAEEIERDEAASFARGVPQKVTNAVADKLAATKEFTLEDVSGEEEEQLPFGGEADVERPEDTPAPQLGQAEAEAGGAVQQGDAVSTASTTTTAASTAGSTSTSTAGKGRASSRRS
jgi:hypothetical protein